MRDMKDTDSTFLGLLTLVFITLKLTGFIGWSWLWVLSPMWLPLAVALGILALVFLGALISSIVEAFSKDKHNG